MLGMEVKCTLLWSGKGDGGVGVMVKEKLSEKVVEVRMVSDRVMSVALVLEKDVQRPICGNASLSGRNLGDSLLMS